MATERVTERSDGLTNERVVERDAGGTTYVDKGGSGLGGIIIGIGLVMSVLQERVSPSTLPVTSCAPISESTLPVKVSPCVAMFTAMVRAPIGVLMVTFQLPSADISSLPKNWMRT